MSCRQRTLWMAVAAAVAMAAPAVVAAQGASTGTITGRVTDRSGGQPLAGAQVRVMGTNLGTIANEGGEFRLPSVPAGAHQLRAIRIGYAAVTQPVTVTAGGTATVNFALEQAATSLDVVTVTATGETQRKRENGTNVGTFSVDSLPKAAVQNFSNVLNGRVAGVTVLQSGGTTGAGARVRVRGANSVSLSNEPLLIIDGVRVNNDPEAMSIAVGGQEPSRLNDINPEDIDNVEVLKGPAASALYGTAAANGVIQITTKRGTAGETRWNAYAEGGTVRETNDYPANWGAYGDFGDGSEFFCDRITASFGDCTQDSVTSFNPLEANSPFRNGTRAKYGFDVSGGAPRATYFLSGSREDENGIYETSALDRTNLRANLRAEVTRTLDATVTAGYLRSNLRLPQNDNNFLGYISNGLAGKAQPETERSELNAEEGCDYRDGGYDPIGPCEINRIRTFQNVDRFTGGVTANFRPLSWLSFTGQGGYDQLSRFDNETFDPGAVNFSDLPEGLREGNRFQVYNYTANISGTATFNISPTVVSTTSTGYQFQRELFTGIYAQGRVLAAGTNSLAGLASRFEVDEDYTDNRTVGAFVSQQVAWRDRVFLTGAIRGDDNSAFGSDFGFVYYPSVNASWVVSEEPFFPGGIGVSSLRLRGAYGRSGLRPNNRDALLYFEPQAARAGSAELSGVTIGGLGRRDLKPEIITETEFGLDAGFLGGRLNTELTYFDKQSTDALIRRRLGASVGRTVDRFENIGSVQNRGVEWLATAGLVDTPNLQWNATLQGSTVHNQLLSFGDTSIAPIIFGAESSQQHREGYSLGGYWGIPVDSAVDVNTNGQIDLDEVFTGSEERFLGNSIPTRQGSLSTDVTLFRVVRLSALADYRGGYKLYNASEVFRCQIAICRGAVDPSASVFDQTRAIAAINGIYSPMVEDADFVKLREVAVTLFAPQDLARRFRTSALSLTLAGRNLGTWTDYTGLDPEVSYTGQSNFTSADFLTQPQVRYFTARVTVGF